MQIIITGSLIISYIFIWVLCVASKQNIGIDECEEQEEWLRKYKEHKQRKLEEKRKRRK